MSLQVRWLRWIVSWLLVVLYHALCIESSLRANIEDETRVSHPNINQGCSIVMFICFHFIKRKKKIPKKPQKPSNLKTMLATAANTKCFYF